jgi:hypothetical protein
MPGLDLALRSYLAAFNGGGRPQPGLFASPVHRWIASTSKKVMKLPSRVEHFLDDQRNNITAGMCNATGVPRSIRRPSALSC